MKVLFIQRYTFTYAGIISILGYLSDKNYECEVLIDALHNKNQLLNEIQKINPDIICFSVMSTDHNWLVNMVKKVKSAFPAIPINVGGIHPILYCEDVINIPEVEYVCYGEGEISMFQLLEFLEGKINISQVGGIAYKKDNKIIKTPLNKFIELGTFKENREPYYKRYNLLANLPLKVFFSSRGCPFTCSFCVNEQLQTKFKGLGAIVRQKPVEVFISEIQEIKEKYGMKFIFIADDLFLWNKKWLKEFAVEYKKRINIPFLCTCRADIIDEEMINIIAEAGCHSITFGVETGNEELRKTVLNKRITDEQLINACKLIKKAGILPQTSNMFCLPGETL